MEFILYAIGFVIIGIAALGVMCAIVAILFKLFGFVFDIAFDGCGCIIIAILILFAMSWFCFLI